MINIGIGTALISAILGYAVVFLGIVFLMVVIILFGKLAVKDNAKSVKSTGDNQISVSVPEGVNPKKIAAVMAVIAEMEREA